MAAGKKTGGRKQGTGNRRSADFAAALKKFRLNIPREAARLYRELENPLKEVRSFKDMEKSAQDKVADKIAERYENFKRMQIDVLFRMAPFVHPKLKESEVEVAPADSTATHENPVKRASTGALLSVVGGRDEQNNAATGS